MSFDADLTACADLVRRGDPDRFLAVMAAPVAARRRLFPIFAFNIEVSRAPWVTRESMIAEMRLQWWRDALAGIAAGSEASRHEVVTPLAAALTPDLARDLDGLVAARRWDIYRDPFEDEAVLDAYLDATSGALLWAAARSLGPAEAAKVRAVGYAAGVANWLLAVPALEAQGRIPLLDGTPDGVARLARKGLDRLDQARSGTGAVSAAAVPALRSAWQTRALLRQAVADPARVARGSLGLSAGRKRLSLMMRAASGRW